MTRATARRWSRPCARFGETWPTWAGSRGGATPLSGRCSARSWLKLKPAVLSGSRRAGHGPGGGGGGSGAERYRELNSRVVPSSSPCQTSPAWRPRNAPAPPPPAPRPPSSPPPPRPSSRCAAACRTTPRSPASGATSGSPTSPSAPRASSSRPTGWHSPPARSTS
eukprot:scaffold45989_cov72-Phaeocystis_antarctica.AAC.2